MRRNLWLARCLVEGEKPTWSYNMATVPLDQARALGDKMFKEANKDFSKELPNFDANYKMVQEKLTKALGIPRNQMPVIEPPDMDKFQKDIESGRVDIFAPYAKGKLFMPKDFPSPQEGEQWVGLGLQDGDPKDDVIKAPVVRREVKDLVPVQNQIWLDYVFVNLIKYGTPKQGSSVTETTIIISKEGYILDGHHRYGQCMLADPGLKIKCLLVPFDVKFLLALTTSYGSAIGNKPNESM